MTEIEQAVERERDRIADGMRAWLVSRISDYELCSILGISKYDWNILIQEKQATWNSYIGSLVDDCDNPDCKVKKLLDLDGQLIETKEEYDRRRKKVV